jgi:hypothetical protein
MLTTNQKGTVAEAAVILECARLGIGVSRPLGDERYDLIFDLGEELVRVQCKWAATRGDVLVVPLYSARRTATGLQRSFYGNNEVDAFAAYSPHTGRCYYARMRDVSAMQALSLRFGPSKNNQAKHVRWASDYEFSATLGARLGP